jgi:signal transduction histidine kinase
VLSIRLAFIAFSIVVFVLVSRSFSKKTVRILVPLWVFLTMLLMLSINTTRPADYSLGSIFDIIFLFISYYLIPARFSLKIGYSIIYSATNVIIVYLLRTAVPEFEKTMILFSYIMVNIIGILTVRAAGLRQRELFAALEREAAGMKTLATYARNLTQAKADLDAYAKTMANELKSGLTGIIGYLELLKGEKRENGLKESYLYKIEQSAQQLDSNVDSLLDLAHTREKEPTDNGP